jgi:hypothetical protein
MVQVFAEVPGEKIIELNRLHCRIAGRMTLPAPYEPCLEEREPALTNLTQDHAPT